MQTHLIPLKTHTSIFRGVIAGALLLLCGHLPAQGDPFKKEPALPLQPGESRPLTAETLQEIADRAQPGILGVAVYDFQSGNTQGVNLKRPFSTQSVFKAFLSATILSQVDQGKVALEQTVTLSSKEVRQGYGEVDHSGGGTFPVRALLQAALIDSDNSAADALLALAGGPATVTAWLHDKGIEGIRVDRSLRSQGQAWEKISAAAALADPLDTATPQGAIDFLVALKKGQLLSPASTDLLLGWMGAARTGQGRLRAGFSAPTALAHKTGTSVMLDGLRVATNDIGLATLPDGHTLAIVVFLANAPGSDETRDAVLAACARVAAQAK